LDFYRLGRCIAPDVDLNLVIENWIEGGTKRAAADNESVVRSENTRALRVTAQQDGKIHVGLDGLSMLSVFCQNEQAALFGFLAAFPPARVIVHHLLGFDRDFVNGLHTFLAGRLSIFHIHDFYYGCPRVTMVDSSGGVCRDAPPDRCARCIELDGSHPAHRMDLSPDAHRRLFKAVLTRATRVIAPSEDTASRLKALIPTVQPEAIPHPQAGTLFPAGARRGTATDICLLGAIGPEKGCNTLLALARYARLSYPEFRFHVIGYTSMDPQLISVGNVSICGKYRPDDLPDLVEATQARIALFLHAGPETFSYTLTEAAGLGLIPVVPDLGAPAERVRQAQFGVVYPFTADCATILTVLCGIGDGTVAFSRNRGSPRGFDTGAAWPALRHQYRTGGPAPMVNAVKPAGRRRKAV
jgi:glycosyltransferase involved in cell wall biosynthesis